MNGPSATSAPWIARLRQRLLAFFHRTRDERAMPWRETADPYAIWVSEIMLQQTRVETVIPYFRAWMERFPTVEELARAAEGEVLKRWEGLGYYSRARNLHRAAKLVRERHAGRVPDRLEDLRGLPGVGPYTAGAVGSIAFGLPVPAVDGNVRRVVSRLLDEPAPSPRELERIVGEWVPAEAPGDFNQALMELGATVCVPKSPRCGRCPTEDLCAARAAGTVDDRPAPKKPPKVRRELHEVTVAVQGWPDGSDRAKGPLRLALRKRPDSGLLAGLWEFPGRVVSDGDAPPTVGPGRPGTGERGPDLPEVRHAFTHLHVTYRPHLVSSAPDADPPAGCRWFSPEEVEALPLPVAQQSIVESALAAAEASGED